MAVVIVVQLAFSIGLAGVISNLHKEISYISKARQTDYTWSSDRHWELARQVQLIYEFLNVKEKVEPKRLVKNV